MAQKTDSLASKFSVDSTNTKTKSADSLLKKTPSYHALLIGVDAVKLGYTFFDNTKFRLEAIAEYKWKKNTWLSAEYGMCNATYNGQFVKYNSKTNGINLGIHKAFFETKNSPKDINNAFVGFQLGGAVASTSDATYLINDLWGTSNGKVPGQTKTIFFTGITGGFRFKITKYIALGWRAKGKVLINPKAFNAIAPIYVALYGKGDKLNIFDYNMYLCWQIR